MGPGRKVKTTMDIDENVLKRFNTKCLHEAGFRKRNDVLQHLMVAYCNGDIKVDVRY
jgi:hypothetical protein